MSDDVTNVIGNTDPDAAILNAAATTNSNGEVAFNVVAEITANGGGGDVTCEKGIFNLIGGVPLTILAQNIIEICDITFYKDNGKQVFISYKNLNTSVEVCANKTLMNLTYKMEGKIDNCN